MKALGLFLGVEPNAGGMFQYAQSILEGLRPLTAEGVHVEVAYVDALWRPLLDKYPFNAVELTKGKAGQQMAAMMMFLRLPAPLIRWLSGLINPVHAQLAALQCDLYLFPAQDALAYQVNLPVVSSIHDLMHRYEFGFPEVSKGGRFGIREHRFRNLAHWSKAVLVDSQIGREQVVASYGTSADKVHPLPYVAPSYIHDPEPADFDQRYPMPAKFLFYPAQFWAHKNHQRLDDAAALVRDCCPDIALVFTGGHRHGYDALRAHVDRVGLADRVLFPGYVPDAYLSGFYRRARALVMPTFFGPTNIPPLEAFACGCAVAISGTYGMPEQAHGAALHFDPRSTPEIAEVIRQLWLDDALCLQLVARGHENAQTWSQADFGHKLRDILRTTAQSA